MRRVIRSEHPRSNESTRPATRLRRVAVAAVVALIGLVPVTAWAGHQYDDVATSYKYHKAIDTITDAGISNGCGGGSFCPTDSIQRDQLAVWLTRSSSRIAESTTVLDSTVRDADGDSVVGSVTITVPGIAGGTQYVELIAQVTVQEGGSDCPCMVVGELRAAGAGSNFSDAVVHVPTGGPFFDVNTLTVVGATAATTGSHTYEVVVNTVGASALMDVVEVHVIARTIPFGSL